jgi:hypothetical protein
MADTKASALPDNPTPARTDLLYVVDDPAGTPASTGADVGSVVDLADHDALTNFAADEHVAHSGVDIGTAATSGLSGGGSIAATRALVVAPAQATAKTAPIPADLILIGDTEAASAVKKSTAAELSPAINAQVTLNAETASFTFALTDRGKTTTISNAGATTATIPPNSIVAFPVDTILVLEQIGAGACTWTPGAGVTINNNANVTLVTNGQHSVSFARQTAPDVWTVYGNVVPLNPIESWEFAISDETTALTTGAAKLSWRTPYAITLTDIKADVVTAPTDAAIIIDVHDGATSIMTTDKLTIDATEFSTRDAGTGPTLTDTALAAGALITFDIDQVGSTIAGAGAKVSLIGRRT